MDGHKGLFLSSFSYKFSLGFQDYPVRERVSLDRLVGKIRTLGCKGVQICGHAHPESLTQAEVQHLASTAANSGVAVEWGFDSWDEGVISTLVQWSKITQSPRLRGVFGAKFLERAVTGEQRLRLAVDALSNLLPVLERSNIQIVMENHFDLTSDQFRALVQEINHPLVCLCLDLTNSIADLEMPERTIKKLAPFSTMMHLKDMRLVRMVGCMQFLGAPLGSGIVACEALLHQALRLNPDLDVCVELGLPWPEGYSEDITTLEDRWVAESVQNARCYLDRFYQQAAGSQEV
jgi:sugar phosphate isomerase/epimerase